MKRLMKVVTSIALVIAVIFTLSATVFAAGKVVEKSLAVGEDKSLPWSDVPYVSSNPSVIEIRKDGNLDYTAVAVGAGEAEVTGGIWMEKPRDTFHFTVYRTEFGKHVAGMSTGARIALAFSILVLLLILAGCVYIFIEAPKCGMSRAWAIMPLLSYGLGLLAFILVRSKRKSGVKVEQIKKITCPTCGGVHPDNVTFCNICGTKLIGTCKSL